MLKVKSINESIEIILGRFGQFRTEAESVPLEGARQRVLAEDILAQDYVPDFTRSTVDGYAVRAQDVFGSSEAIPAFLRQIGEVKMGQPAALSVGPGECVYVPTGGEVPQGADAMIMLEFAEQLAETEIAVNKASAPGANLIFRGDDLKPGDIFFRAGRMLSVPDLGALAAMGRTTVPVRKPVRVGIISSGDELLHYAETLSPGKIRDVNAPMLTAAVIEAGGSPAFLGIVEDEERTLRVAVEVAIGQYDMLLMTGGTSVGTLDAVPRVIAELGELLVHGVAAKPGKPTLFGEIAGKPVFGLPGNPVAAYFMFITLARPLLLSLLGASLLPRTVRAELSRAVPSNHGREEFVPVVLRDGLAVPIASKSGLITTLAAADGYIRIPRDLEGLAQGELVEVSLFLR